MKTCSFLPDPQKADSTILLGIWVAVTITLQDQTIKLPAKTGSSPTLMQALPKELCLQAAQKGEDTLPARGIILPEAAQLSTSLDDFIALAGVLGAATHRQGWPSL